MKRLIVFDLDGTLARSKSPVDPGMSTLLTALLGVTRAAIISGGAWPQFEAQLLRGLPRDERLSRLSLLPTCGTKFFVYRGDWTELYSEDLGPGDRDTIVHALARALKESGFAPTRVWGQAIEDRGSQITLSVLGQQAPLDAKIGWDPDFTRRKKIKAILDTLLPGFSVRLGGMTSIDVTRSGIDKGYGLGKLRDLLGIALEEMVFVGDALFVGGNDRPAMDAGVASIEVRDPEDTRRIIETLVACLEPS